MGVVCYWIVHSTTKKLYLIYLNVLRYELKISKRP